MKHGYVRGPQRREGRPIVCTEGLASHVVLALEDSRSRLGAALVPAARAPVFVPVEARTCPRPRGGAVPDHRVLESRVEPPRRSRAPAAAPQAPPAARTLAYIPAHYMNLCMYGTSKLEMFVWKLV